MAVPEGNSRRGKPVWMVYANPPNQPSSAAYQIGDVFASLEDAMLASVRAAKQKTLDFEFVSDKVSDFYWAEAEDETMYTIHCVVPRWPIN